MWIPPSVWEAAKDRAQKTDWKIHVDAQRKLSTPGQNETLEGLFVDSARILLEDVHAADREGTLLRYDLAEAYSKLHLPIRAAAVLEKAVKDDPDDPYADDARLQLALEYARLQRYRSERDTYLDYLRRKPQGAGAVNALLNLAESEMHLGNLRGAIAGYHRAQDAASEGDHRETLLLAVWGLVVALDRFANRLAELVAALGRWLVGRIVGV